MASAHCKMTLRSVVVAALLFPVGALADFTLHHWEDHYEPVHSVTLGGDFLYYQTNQNYDLLSNKVSPSGLNTYKRYEGDAIAQFGLLDRISFFGRVSWSSIQLNHVLSVANSSGFTDQTVGGNFRAYESTLGKGQSLPISLDLQIQADIPAYSNSGDDATKTPYLGDQTFDETIGGFITLPVTETEDRVFSILGGAGFTFRTGHYSSQVPWTITGSTTPKKSGFLLNASAFGVSSLKNDTTLQASKPSGFATGSGGSFITDGINSGSIILRGQLGYQLEGGTQLLVAYEQSIWGQDAPNGSSLIFGFRTSFGAQTDEKQIYNKGNKGLQSYSLDAKVLSANDRLNLVKIDKGSDEGVAKGQVFDIFSVTAAGEAAEAVARAEVTSVKSDEAALTVVEYFKEVWVNEGFVAKRLVQ
jgi:hypothetical protein